MKLIIQEATNGWHFNNKPYRTLTGAIKAIATYSDKYQEKNSDIEIEIRRNGYYKHS